MPRKPTQKDRVVQYIDDFGFITSWQAYADLGITQLGACIFYLKEDGWEFKTSWVHDTNIYGDPVKYVEYRIASRPIDNLFSNRVMQRLVKPRVAVSNLEPLNVRRKS